MSYEGYFDYASATPVSSAVFKAMEPYFSDSFHNPSAIYDTAERVHQAMEAARKSTALVLGVKPQTIIWTSGCTEANNLAIHGIMRHYPGAKVLFSAVEHDSVRRAAELYDYGVLPVNTSGIIDTHRLEAMLSDDVVLVSVMYANNEVGSVQPLREVSQIIAKAREKRGQGGLPIYLHTDAAQAANYLDLHVSGLGVDLMSMNSAKIYGPKGAGCLYIGSNVHLQAQVMGGGQERGLRSGTENVPAIIGFAAALTEAQNMRASEVDRIDSLREKLNEGLADLGGIVHEKGAKHLPNICSVELPGVDNERLVMQLSALGIMVSTGSACHARSGGSTVLSALGCSDASANATIRIAMGRFTTEKGVENLLSALSGLVAKNR